MQVDLALKDLDSEVPKRGSPRARDALIVVSVYFGHEQKKG